MRFTKMHGLGNDYVYVDAIVDPTLRALDWQSLAPMMSDRHRGVGGDGVIVIAPPHRANHHARMRTFNADGSEAEACGNGTRCVARYLFERHGHDVELLAIESGQRVLECDRTGDELIRVAMGIPGIGLDTCAVEPDALHDVAPSRIGIDGHALEFHAVSIGNPHAVVFAHENEWLGVDLESQIRRLGPRIETHRAFRERINVHFVRVDGLRHATMYTWERGAGITQACGTGACAVIVASVLEGLLEHESELVLPGGGLHVSWHPDEAGGDGIVRQAGPAEFVFDGVWIDQYERTLA